jgi:hypothetical protein
VTYFPRHPALVGDWEKIGEYLSGMPEMIKKLGDSVCEDAAIVTAQEIRIVVLSKRIYRSRFYYKNIGVYRDRETGRWFAGVPSKMHQHSKRVNLRALAFWLEYGTVKMMPRSHYRVAYAKVGTIIAGVVKRRGLKFLGRL